MSLEEKATSDQTPASTPAPASASSDQNTSAVTSESPAAPREEEPSSESASAEVSADPPAPADSTPEAAVTTAENSPPEQPQAEQPIDSPPAPLADGSSESTESTPVESPAAVTPEVIPQEPVSQPVVHAETPPEASAAPSTTPPSSVGIPPQAAEAATAPAAPEAQQAPTPPPAVPAPDMPVAESVSDSSPPPPAPRKVQLNPTWTPGEAKAVPSIPNEGGATAESAAQESGAGSELSAEAVPARGPVEIPQVESLDDDLESQLNAALQGTSQTNAAGLAADPAAAPRDETELEPGTRLKGRVDSIDQENVLLDLGYRATGVLSRRHFTESNLPQVGSELEVVVESVNSAEGTIQLGLLKSAHRSSGDWETLVAGQVIECTVQKTNKGGLEVQVGQLRGFMPAGQVDLYFVGDLEPFVGQKLTAKVMDVNPKKRNLVVSRRALLQEERDQTEAEVWETLSVGEQRPGTIKTLKDYGAFVDIGGVDGLLHVRELSWTRVNHPSDVLSEGQQVEVKILSLDRDKKKISLGMKQLMTNPWDYAEQKYPKNTVVNGLVKKVTDFGAFVELEPGLEGLIHISELDYRRVNNVQEVLQEGQETEAQVLEINKNKRRISLSLKSLKQKPGPTPEEQAAQQASEEEQRQRREADAKRRKTLKGGIGGNKGGGLFGNPSDY